MNAIAETIERATPVDAHDLRFHWHDTGVHLIDERGLTRGWDELKLPIIGHLRRRGFKVHQDESVAKCIRSGHYLGARGDLKLVAEFFGRCASLTFFQDVVAEHRSGGRYDFDKLKKMPYLIRLRFLWAKRIVTNLLLDQGYADTTKPTPANALAAVMQHRAELEAFQGKSFYNGPTANGGESYNNTDADGRRLRDGDVRYFRGYGGHLLRGVVYHHINNMWWVVVNADCYRNVACWRLFTYDPARHPRRVPEDPEKSIRRRLAKAVEATEFERAIGLRDALARLTKGGA